MTQVVSIIRDPFSTDPSQFIPSPYALNIWTNDQSIVWQLLVDGWHVSAILFDQKWFDAGGGWPTPQADGTWHAEGPGPLDPDQPSTGYAYTILVHANDSNDSSIIQSVRVGRQRADGVVVDPDVWNQPQP
jgi:hypothetical protein